MVDREKDAQAVDEDPDGVEDIVPIRALNSK